MKKNFIFLILALILCVGFFIFLESKKTVIIESDFKNVDSIITEKKDSKINLMAVGDIMLDRGVEFMIQKEGSSDFRFSFLKIKNYLGKADILFGNLESVVSDKGYKQGSIYSFRADPRAVEGLLYSGFDIVSTTNNHAFDYGKTALLDSLERLKKSGIEYVGAGIDENEAFSLKIKEIKNTKIGFLAYDNVGTENWKAVGDKPGIAFLDNKNLEKVKNDISKARKQVDVLAVSMHWGDEYLEKPNLIQKKLAKEILNAGADIIIGSHPHVVEDLEEYNGKWVAYSLGNFVFDQYFSESTMQGGILEITIESKKIKSAVLKIIKINQFYQPELR